MCNISAGKIKMSKSASVSPEINLIGKTTDEAIMLLDKYLDDAFISRMKTVRIIHGKGTGVLRKTLQEYLKDHRLVKSYQSGDYHSGGLGVTEVELDL